MASLEQPLIFLMGPTGSGKTDLAVELCQQLSMEIISVDSAMIYRGMDIGTAKPGRDILEIAPHHLIDICDPSESYSAARFCEDANQLIDEIHARGKIPLLVGGTGLYFRSLQHGLSELPSANREIRAMIEADAEQHGWEYMHKKLNEVDPQSAQRIHPNDPQRIQRALEVYRITGKSLSSHFETADLPTTRSNIVKLAVTPTDRGLLHNRIQERFHTMLSRGLVDEVKMLYQRDDLHPRLPAIRLVGYRQVWQFLSGKLDYDDMIEHAIVATRQLARRQLTWLRKENDVIWIDSEQKQLVNSTLHLLRENGRIS